MFFIKFFRLKSRLSALAEFLVLLTTNEFMVPSITGSMALCRGRGWGTLESQGRGSHAVPPTPSPSVNQPAWERQGSKPGQHVSIPTHETLAPALYTSTRCLTYCMPTLYCPCACVLAKDSETDSDGKE